MTYLSYVGIGSRETPPEIQEVMYEIAQTLDHRGWTLRSGGAKGADTAFERGARNKEIYLPWAHFNNNRSLLVWAGSPAQDSALRMAKEYHPAWDNLTHTARLFMARNSMQLFGWYMDMPSKLIICWTPNGSGSGGTGQALRIARAHHIPIVDLGGISLETAQERLNNLILKIEKEN